MTGSGTGSGASAPGRPGGPAGTGTRPRRARNSLSRDEILETARRLVEDDGLARLSMPALARSLGCAVMSIYRYFATKNELVEALAEQVMRDLHRRLPPAGDGPWREEFVAYFIAYRELLREVTVYREVILFAPAAVLRAALTPAQLRRLDSGIGLLRRAGLSVEDATRVYNVCVNYTSSAAFGPTAALARAEAAPDRPETADPREVAPDRAAGGVTASPVGEARLPAAEYPNLALLPDISAALDPDETGFRLGLELLAEGIAHTYPVRRGL